MKLLLYLLPLLFVQQTAQLQSGRISGQIRDTAGRPVSGVRVFAIAVQTDVVGVRAGTEILNSISLTDRDGRFLLEDVPPGRYRIGAGSPGSPVYYPGGTAAERGTIVTMAAGQPVANIDFTFTFLSKPNELWGTVGLDDGTPLPADLPRKTQFILSSARQHWVTGPFTRQQGVFFFKSMDLEEFDFSVAPPLGYYVKSATYGNVDLTRARLNLAGGLNETELRVVLTKTRPQGVPAGVRVSGRVTSWKLGVPNLELRALVTVLDRTPNVTTIVADVEPRADGSFQIEGVPPGQYTLRLPLLRSAAQSLTFDVAGTDVVNLDLNLVTSGSGPFMPIPVQLRKDSITPIKGNVDVVGPVPGFEILFTPTRPNGPAPQSVKVSGKEFSIPLPEAEYRASISGLPTGYAVVSVSAGPLQLSEPFLVTGKGIADRFTGLPILNRPGGGGPATSVGITVKLRTSEP